MNFRIAGLAGLLLALVPTPAAVAGGTVSVDPSAGLRIVVSETGSDVHVQTTDSNTKLFVTETANRTLTPGAGCEQSQSVFNAESKVRCNRPTLRFVTFQGAGFRDRLIVTAGVGDCQCNGSSGNDEIRTFDGADLIIGGPGNDLLRGGEGGDVLQGQSGNDTLFGEGGNDTLEGDTDADTLNGGDGTDSFKGGDGADVLDMGGAADGADTLDGGFGIDRVDYGGRRAAVSATIDSSTNDGAVPGPGQLFGERDFISGSVENLTGGAGGDTLTGGRQPNRLIGGGGNDTIRGGTPNAADAGFPDDYLEGGPGVDVLRGEGGVDVLNARDAIDDQVDAVLSCGTGPGSVGSENDRLDADIRDDDTRALPPDCESVDQGMVGEDPNVHIRSVRRVRGEGLVVALRCPRKARTGCEGSLAAKRLGKASARGGGFGERVKYAIKRGKRGKVTVPSRTRAGTLVRIRSLEKGRLGPRTTFRTLEVK